MSNATITFTAKRSLVPGITVDDELSLAVTLSAFDLSTEVNKKTSRPMDGGPEESSLFYIGDSYSLTIMETGTVTLPNLSTTPLTTEYIEMFLRSVAASEAFTITSLDDGDAELDVQLVGTWSRQRRSSSFVNEFSYSFKVRTI